MRCWDSGVELGLAFRIAANYGVGADVSPICIFGPTSFANGVRSNGNSLCSAKRNAARSKIGARGSVPVSSLALRIGSDFVVRPDCDIRFIVLITKENNICR